MFCPAAMAAHGGASIESVGIPKGFEELSRDRDLLVDLYFGGRKIGEARIVAGPGSIRFRDPRRVLGLIPNLAAPDALAAAFAADFPANAGRACGAWPGKGCGELSPQVAGLIFDEERFRVDLFVNPRFLEVVRPGPGPYLPAPTAPLSLTSSSGLALSGSAGTAPDYNLQNRTILGFRNARIRSESSFASHLGFTMDTLVGEVDRPGVRYSAGLFWAPGLDLTGERRIAGFGVATQFDTRSDRDSLEGTPLVLFLARPARVDLLVDGRLVASGAYEAGNVMLDSSSLPDGSYSLVLRIHEANGSVRDEQRFFARNALVPPAGHPVFFAYAGKLANSRAGQPVSLSGDLFYQLGAARRLGRRIAADLSLVGTPKRPLLEAGAWLMGPPGRLRVAALASPAGDRGFLVQAASDSNGPLIVNLDLRRIRSHDGSPLIPLSATVDTFSPVPVDQRQAGLGSYTQASGSVGYRLGAAYLSIIGSLRKDGSRAADYSAGPNLSWPMVAAAGFQLTLQADAQLMKTGRSGYVGFRAFYSRAGYSVSNSFGGRGVSDNSGAGRSAAVVGDTTAHLSWADDSGTNLSAAAGYAREAGSSSIHGDGLLTTRFGSAHAQLLHATRGGGGTQYSLALQTGAVVNRDDMVVGGRELAESALVVAVDGAAPGSRFDVMVDGQKRGRVGAGGRLPIFLEPYRSYSVTLKPADAESVWYDSAERRFTLYPGNVQHVLWHVEHLVTLFGQAVRADGSPVAGAIVTSRRGTGETDARGYFQIESSANDMLSFEVGDAAACKVAVGAVGGRDYARVGRVVCR